MSLNEDFEHIVDLCALLEGCSVPPRVRARIGNAYKRSLDKGLTLTWEEHCERPQVVIDWFLMRHAMRGAREMP